MRALAKQLIAGGHRDVACAAPLAVVAAAGDPVLIFIERAACGHVFHPLHAVERLRQPGGWRRAEVHDFEHAAEPGARRGGAVGGDELAVAQALANLPSLGGVGLAVQHHQMRIGLEQGLHRAAPAFVFHLHQFDQQAVLDLRLVQRRAKAHGIGGCRAALG